jgi:two-component system, OmpR family, phosphate regulon sensor histidine kinase PhoR
MSRICGDLPRNVRHIDTGRRASRLEPTSPHRDVQPPFPRSGLFWKLLLAFALLSVTAILLLTWLFSNAYEALLEREQSERIESSATAAAELLAPRWPAAPDATIQAELRRLGAATGVRLTLVAPDGVVLADSELKDVPAVEALENHADRTEIVAALKNGDGTARRTSPTIGARYRYYAKRVDRDDKPIGVVRAAIPTAPMLAEVDGLNRWVWTIGGLLAVAAAVVAYWVAARLTDPLRSLAQTAEALAAGRYEQRMPMPAGKHDELTKLAASLNEVGRRLAQREGQLRSTSQTQTTVLEAMSESVIAVDRSEKVLFANASAARALGFDASRVEGHPLLEAVRSHELRAVVQQALRSRRPSSGEIAWRGKSQRIFDVLATPLPGEPLPGVVVVLRDVSEVKRLEQMRQQFIANVSHELKTPLSSIKAYTETLLGGALKDPVHGQRFLERIDEQATRLHQLIMDMLSLARIESSQAPLELTDVPLARVIQRTVVDHERQAAAKEVTLENRFSDLAVIVRADEEALRQILNNLIDNAVKYTPPGGRVTVSGQADGSVVLCEVTDTGPGIPAEHHSRLFERFYRVDKARSRELGGTGLGLAIVKHLTQAMGGSVEVSSQVGRGSTFTVRLPAANG